MAKIYVLTSATGGGIHAQFRAYLTQTEADDEKKAFTRWRSDVIHVFSNARLIFASLDDLREIRKRWMLKRPWGACAMLRGYCDADISVNKMTFGSQADADAEMAVINATARAEEIQLLASLLE